MSLLYVDPELLELSAFSLLDVLLAVFGIVGFSLALFAFLLFLTWSIFQIVRFFRKILD
ncbi:MAG: hypothetical protein ACI4AA_10730 [Lachnospiraceae bacterium]